jgi:hypothetical protein
MCRLCDAWRIITMYWSIRGEASILNILEDINSMNQACDFDTCTCSFCNATKVIDEYLGKMQQ